MATAGATDAGRGAGELEDRRLPQRDAGGKLACGDLFGDFCTPIRVESVLFGLSYNFFGVNWPGRRTPGGKSKFESKTAKGEFQ